MIHEEETHEETHECDYDWFSPDPFHPDPEDEVLACTYCGRVKWTARQLKEQSLKGGAE